MMKRLFSLVAPIRHKSNKSNSKAHKNHDSNEDILRIIRLYNQGTIKTINDDATLNGVKYPCLLKYRASNLYVFLTAALSIFSSIYSNASLSCITLYIIQVQIKPTYAKSTLQNDTSIFSDDQVGYILSSFYLSGLLLGSLMFGWLACQIRHRKYLLLVGTCASILAGGVLMVSFEYWMLFPAKFLQGLSNACIWLMCTALTADVWPQSKRGSMIGFILCTYPLGMTFGLIIGGALFQYADHKLCFYCALVLNCLTLLMQCLVIERFTIPDDWLERRVTMQQTENGTEMREHPFEDVHRELGLMEEGTTLWSKSSSMSTINLRDQPILFEKEKDSCSMQHSAKMTFQNLLVVRLVSSAHFMSLLYQVIAIATVICSLKPTLLIKLEFQMSILNLTYRNIVFSTFLLPCTVSALANGWLCDRFGTKIVGLTSIIISIPAFIWIGVPNQNVQSIASALVVGGITLSGASVSVVDSVITTMQNILLQQRHEETEKQQQQQYLHQHMPAIFATVYFMANVGMLLSFFASKLNDITGFFWLCFILSMLLVTCVPLMACFSKGKLQSNNNQTGFVSTSTSKKSIINNTRPESFAESILSDDETTLGSSSKSDCNVILESKPVIVIP